VKKSRAKTRGSRRSPENVGLHASAPRDESDHAGAGTRLRGPAVLLFVILLLAYLSNGIILPGNDAVPNVRLPVQLLERGSVFFSPEDNPKMFEFAMTGADGGKQFARFASWNASYQGKPVRELYQSGQLTLSSPKYYLTPTVRPDRYASTFGLGAGLTALPVFAAAKLFASPLSGHLSLLWHMGKLVAAALVAGSALFLFLAAAAHVSRGAAFLLAAAYGLGTCVWSTSSQALWQHGPCEFFLAMGAFYLLRKQRRHADALSGLALGLAVFCRPTVALVVLSVLLWLAFGDRRRLLRFVLGGLPVAVVALVYAQVAFGNPFTFGQLANGVIAQSKTGNPGLWQTPLYLGAAGLLASPARGLLVYSPIALFALWGMGRAFRDPEWRELRPLALGAAALFVLSAKWFDWWGGWCFGYRPIVDTAILLAFLALPVVERVRSGPFLKTSFAVLLVWSVGVQVIGAFAYDVGGWNSGLVYDVSLPGTHERVTFVDKQDAIRYARDRGSTDVVQRNRDIDRPENRHRLWSLTDSPIPYYLGHFASARQQRRIFVENFLKDDG
jgi:hypothetical protein